MLSGVHHPTDVALQGRVGAVPGLPLPRRLKGRGEKSTRLVAELFMLNPTGFATETIPTSHLGIDGPTFLHDWVEARRHGRVLPVRRARRAGRPGTAVVGRVRHGSWQRASY